MIESSAWVDKYQPKKVADCFLPAATRNELNKILEKGESELKSMIFAGPAGIGKTTVAKALVNELDLETYFVNASLVGIDAVRTDIVTFASSLSFNGKRKVVILDEADGLTAAAQAALRGIMNEYADNVVFILTANFRNKLIEPIISRLDEVSFQFAKNEIPDLAKGLYQFIMTRLDEGSVNVDPKAVQQFLRTNLTLTQDIRKILIRANKIALTGVFNMDSLLLTDDSRLEELVQLVQSRSFDRIRTWVGENSDIDNADIVRYLYVHIKEFAQAPKIPMIVEIINRHQFQHAFVIDKEINTVAMIAEISVSL